MRFRQIECKKGFDPVPLAITARSPSGNALFIRLQGRSDCADDFDAGRRSKEILV